MGRWTVVGYGVLVVLLLGSTVGWYRAATSAAECPSVAAPPRAATILPSLTAAGTGHVDGADLVAAAVADSVPPIVLLGVIAAETRYGGRYDVVGRHGEYGRGQIVYALWEGFTPACGARDPASQRACTAAILRYCYQRYGSWRRAAMCYNRTEAPERAVAYLQNVEREIGRMVLRGLEP